DLLAHLSELNAKDGQIVAERLLKRWPPAKRADWRSWNWSSTRAAEAVQNHAALLEQISGPARAAPGGGDRF
ncbi:MAG TPA: hypothetical protein VMW51_03560, partial [Terriglobia bacterium]|nr:hypothetical protein [Terriglobia bacterium]